MIVFSALLPHIRLAATALIYNTINSDQFFQNLKFDTGNSQGSEGQGSFVDTFGFVDIRDAGRFR